MGGFCSKLSSNYPDRNMSGESDAGKNKSRKRKLDESDKSGEPSQKKQKMDTQPMTRNEFMKHAKAENGYCGGKKFLLRPKINKSGSVGYHASNQHIMKLNQDKKVAVMMSVNATVVGSKKWEDGKANDSESDNEDDDIEQDKSSKKTPATKEKGDTMTKGEFLSLATNVNCTLFGMTVKDLLQPKKFSTGSVGWSYSGKKFIKNINGNDLALQTSINLIVKKSKQWRKGEESDK